MFSGIRKLGEAQDMAEDIVQDIDEGSDVDFIAVNYMSPDSGYPPQRIENYDEALIQHQTLNGVGQSRLPAGFFPGKFMTTLMAVREKTLPAGAPPTGRSAKALMPRFAHWGATSPYEAKVLASRAEWSGAKKEYEGPRPGWGRREPEGWGRMPTHEELMARKKDAAAERWEGWQHREPEPRGFFDRIAKGIMKVPRPVPSAPVPVKMNPFLTAAMPYFVRR